MGLLSRLKAKATSAPVGLPMAEQTVIARYQLSSGPNGTSTDIHSLATLEDRLIEAISAARVGEFDGNEFGTGEVTLFAYGPDADQLFAAMEPILRSFPARPAHVLLRYGGLQDENAPEALVEL
jgi:putative IMPACT (imprinted ancient) family translation regulator